MFVLEPGRRDLVRDCDSACFCCGLSVNSKVKV